ncbi:MULTISPECIES: GNAT family N-acetyltransferase [unclassified Leucobacter]|uniref:GNAT family N-acetyltransferase n=1 Tax=unclassified Leucobacter TaxID=2621730 RepID=UPI00165EA256|nr:GNAT family N-acetyltransferase [Leucobacter sp. CX169]MBC9926906.1 GNAT family N-acetyltransferase [Leucobacter sp. cx-169]MBC9935132.1 GNAT family N-acetyltransferase [Leucobacter sp. cx-87]
MNENLLLRAADFEVREVPFADPRGEAIREAMSAEMSERYAGSFDALTPEQVVLAEDCLSVDPAAVITTFMAFAPDGTAAAHVMLRDHRGEWEVKRVITAPQYRGTGVGSRVMRAAHEYAAARGAERMVLQCGDRQPEAVAMYTKLGYLEIPVYEPYKSGLPRSRCFAKAL